jgi:hypothetical protein
MTNEWQGMTVGEFIKAVQDHGIDLNEKLKDTNGHQLYMVDYVGKPILVASWGQLHWWESAVRYYQEDDDDEEMQDAILDDAIQQTETGH